MSDLDYLRRLPGAVLVGNVLLGHRNDGRRPCRLSALEGRAVRRLSEMSELAHWRHRYGIMLTNPLGWIVTVANALAALALTRGGPVTANMVMARLPPLDKANVTMEAVLAVMEEPHRPVRLIPANEAGRLVELVEIERAELEKKGVVISTVEARDESPEARALRRAARRREMTRARNVSWRDNQKQQRTKRVTSNAAISHNVATSERDASYKKGQSRPNVATSSTFRGQAAAVRAAISDGHDSVPNICQATGLARGTVAPLLSRLVKIGAIERRGRGAYAAPALG